MPQMSPLNWLFLFIYFIVMVVFLVSFIYFIYLLKFKLTIKSKFVDTMIWMW